MAINTRTKLPLMFTGVKTRISTEDHLFPSLMRALFCGRRAGHRPGAACHGVSHYYGQRRLNCRFLHTDHVFFPDRPPPNPSVFPADSSRVLELPTLSLTPDEFRWLHPLSHLCLSLPFPYGVLRKEGPGSTSHPPPAPGPLAYSL